MEVYRLSGRRSETYAGHAMALLTRTALLLLGLRHTDCKRKRQTDTRPMLYVLLIVSCGRGQLKISVISKK